MPVNLVDETLEIAKLVHGLHAQKSAFEILDALEEARHRFIVRDFAVRIPA